MSEEWLKVLKETPQKPEIIAIAAGLSLTRDDVFGKCFRLWSWADSHTINGCAQRVTRSWVDELVGCAGFADELGKVGWLTFRDGGISIPNFGRHMGKSAKNRALSKERMKRMRCASSVTNAQPEKKRKEKSKDPPSPQEAKRAEKAPDAFEEFLAEGLKGDDRLRSLWGEWFEHRRQKHQPMTKTAAKRLAGKLERWGLVRAIAALEHSLASGYTGVFEGGEGHGGNGSRGGGAGRVELTGDVRQRPINTFEPDAEDHPANGEALFGGSEP